MEIPENNQKTLEKIANKSGIKLAQLESEFTQLYEALSNDEGFKNEEGELMEKELYDYIELRLRGKYEIRQPVNSYDLIVVGMDSISQDKNKINRSSLFAIDREKKLRRISFKGDICDELADIQLFYKYDDVPLAEFKQSGDLMADERTTFGEMTETPLVNNPEKLVQLVNAKKIVLNDIYSSNDRKLKKQILSETDKNGWSIKTDWRAIKGQVTKVSHGSDEEAGTNWASFRIIDSTIPDREIVNEQGEVITPGIRCYTSPFVTNDLPNYSKVWVLGPLSQSKKTGNFSMNAYTVIPIWEPPEI